MRSSICSSWPARSPTAIMWVIIDGNWPVDKLYSTYDELYGAYDLLTAGCSPGERDALFAANAEPAAGVPASGVSALVLNVIQSRSYDGSDAVTSGTRVRMAGGYFGYDENDWEVIGELYQFRNADIAGGASRSSRASFVQLGRTLGSLTPFVRLEQVALDGADKYFLSQSSGRSYRREVVGHLVDHRHDQRGNREEEQRRRHMAAELRAHAHRLVVGDQPAIAAGLVERR